MTQEKWQDTLVSIKNKIFTARNAKIAAAFIVVAALAGAGGRYYLHQRHIARHAEEVAAMADMTQAQAKQKGVSLINEEQARAAAAKAIGKDESELDFKEVVLFDMASMKHHDGRDEHKKERRGEREHEKGREHDDRDRQDRPEGMRPGRPDERGPMGEQNRQGDAPTMALQPPQELMTPPAAGQQSQQQTPQGQQPIQQGQQPAQQGQTQQGQQPAQNPMQPGFHPMYNVRAVSGSVRYNILIDAVTGSVIHTQIDD